MQDDKEPTLDEAATIAHYRDLRRKGMSRPQDCITELWEAAGPVGTGRARSVLQNQLDELIAASADRPPAQDVREATRRLAPQALAVHAEIMNSETAKEETRLTAARFVYEQAEGKAQQTIEHKGNLAMDVFHQIKELQKKQSSLTLEATNLLAKPPSPVDTFLKKHMPEKYVVGRKSSVTQSGQPEEGLARGTGEEAKGERGQS